MVSFSNFASRYPTPKKMKQAAEIVKKTDPHLIVDGEMQASTALNSDIMQEFFPFCHLKQSANVLIFS